MIQQQRAQAPHMLQPSLSGSRHQLAGCCLFRCLQKLLPPGCNEPPNLDLTILMDVPGAKASRPQSPLRSKSPDAELAALVSAIQANNSRLREVEHMMDDTTHNIAHLQVRR
jgi:hypothetical protein